MSAQVPELVLAKIARVERTIDSLVRLKDVMENVITDLSVDLSAVKAELGLTGQPDLPLASSPAPEAPAADPKCECGDVRSRHFQGTGKCQEVTCRCQGFRKSLDQGK